MVSVRYEKRTYIDKETTEKLIPYFDDVAVKHKEERQVIYTYHAEADFRLIRTKDYVKLDLKDSDDNTENRVYINKLYEKDMMNILTRIGTYVAVKRYRVRHMYRYNKFYITLDENIKYGNVLRVSFDADEAEYEQYMKELDQIRNQFGFEISSMETFQELYSKYRTSWADLTKDIDEEKFINGEN